MTIYGRNPVREALRGRRAASMREIWTTERAAKEPWLAGVECRLATSQQISERCGSDAHQGICAHTGPYPYAQRADLLALPAPLIVVLDEVQDPQNLGSICRTAESAGATGLVIHERGGAQVTSAVCKASAGAVEHLAIAKARNIADFLREAGEAGCWCYGAAMPGTPKAVSYAQPDYDGGVVLVLGSEGRGLRPRVANACDMLISLPMRGKVQSLGVSAAAAAILYRILQDRPPAA
jgi:23S rRNA (guanosine2251-2'-O)-methyltransferase